MLLVYSIGPTRFILEVFTPPELKTLMKQSFELKTLYPGLKQPGVINCIVSESK